MFYSEKIRSQIENLPENEWRLIDCMPKLAPTARMVISKMPGRYKTVCTHTPKNLYVMRLDDEKERKGYCKYVNDALESVGNDWVSVDLDGRNLASFRNCIPVGVFETKADGTKRVKVRRRQGRNYRDIISRRIAHLEPGQSVHVDTQGKPYNIFRSTVASIGVYIVKKTDDPTIFHCTRCYKCRDDEYIDQIQELFEHNDSFKLPPKPRAKKLAELALYYEERPYVIDGDMVYKVNISDRAMRLKAGESTYILAELEQRDLRFLTDNIPWLKVIDNRLCHTGGAGE